MPYKKCQITTGFFEQTYFGYAFPIIKAVAQMSEEIMWIVSALSTFLPIPSDLRNLGLGAIMLKHKNPSKFNEEKVAPSLEQNFAPTILDHARHWWSLPKLKIKSHKKYFFHSSNYSAMPSHTIDINHCLTSFGENEFDFVLIAKFPEFFQ